MGQGSPHELRVSIRGGGDDDGVCRREGLVVGAHVLQSQPGSDVPGTLWNDVGDGDRGDIGCALQRPGMERRDPPGAEHRDPHACSVLLLGQRSRWYIAGRILRSSAMAMSCLGAGSPALQRGAGPLEPLTMSSTGTIVVSPGGPSRPAAGSPSPPSRPKRSATARRAISSVDWRTVVSDGST